MIAILDLCNHESYQLSFTTASNIQYFGGVKVKPEFIVVLLDKKRFLLKVTALIYNVRVKLPFLVVHADG